MRCNNTSPTERKSILQDIAIIDFAIVDMTEYLDTHPDNLQAIEQLRRYSILKKKLENEYAKKYPPLNLNNLDSNYLEWSWATQQAPWERGY